LIVAVVKFLYETFSFKITGGNKKLLTSDLQPPRYLDLLCGWHLVHCDQLQIFPPVLLPIAHDKSEQVAEFIPAEMEGL